MEDDLVKRRKEKLSPEAQTLFDEINRAGESGAEVSGSEFEGFMDRISELPPEEWEEMLSLLAAHGNGLMQRGEDYLEKAKMLEEVEKVFDAAHEKLRSEGKPIDPDMTVREAYEVLGLAPPE